MAKTTTEKYATPASVVRLIKSEKSRGRDPMLYVAECDGELWATESHWATKVDTDNRLDKITNTLAHYNLKPEVGRYNINSTVTKVEGDAPNLSAIVGSLRRSSVVPLVPMRIGGQHAYVQMTYDGPFVALFERPDGTKVGVRADFLDFLAPAWRNTLGTDRYGELTVLYQREDGGSLGVVGVLYREPSSYDYYAQGGRRERPGRVHEGIVMPVRID